MKNFFGLLVMFMMIASNCFAMTFSQPVEVGSISVGLQSPMGGFFIKNASYNDGNYYTKLKKDNKISYGKGIAVFGEGKDALYVHYDYDKNGGNFLSFQSTSTKFGDKDVSNTVDIAVGYSGTIHQIKSDSGITFYSIQYGYKYSSFYIIGKRQDGKWIKYIDSHNVEKMYYKGEVENFLGYWEKPHYTNKVICNGDMITMPYDWLGKEKIKGEFRFKWDTAAQWFSVEHVVY